MDVRVLKCVYFFQFSIPAVAVARPLKQEIIPLFALAQGLGREREQSPGSSPGTAIPWRGPA